MSSKFLLILVSTISLTEIARSANVKGSVDDDPMVMVKSTLKSWYTMYKSHRDEIVLGYCWADYFIDVKRIMNTLSNARLLQQQGTNPEDPSPLMAILKNWFEDGRGGKTRTDESFGAKVESEKSNDENKNPENLIGDNYNDYNEYRDHDSNYRQGTVNPPYKWDSTDNNNNRGDQFTVHQQQEPYNNVVENFDNNGEISQKYFYPGIYNFEKRSSEAGPASSHHPEYRSILKNVKKSDDHNDTTAVDRKSKPRSLGDLFISVLGFNVPPGVGPLMIGIRGTSPILLAMFKMVGGVVKIGKWAIDTVQKISILACSKDYIISKMYNWIDS